MRRTFPSSSTSLTSITLEHYSIEIPAGYELEDVSPMGDFDLYQVTRRGSKSVVCGLYIGNFPSFPKLDWGSQRSVRTMGDNRTTVALQRPDAMEGVIRFSGLTYKGSTGTPWQAIHYMCDRLDEVGAKEMAAMIASIKVVRPDVD